MIQISRKGKQQATIILILLLAILTFSCKDEETVNPLVGTWTIVSAKFTECTNVAQNSTVTYFCDAQYCTKYTYTADGKLIVDQLNNGVSNLREGTYTIAGNSITTKTTFNGTPVTSTYTFTVNDNSLSLSTTAPYTGANCIYTQFFTK